VARKIAIEGEHDNSVGAGDRRPTGLVFSPDGTNLAAGIRIAEAEIQLWRVSDGTLVRHFKSPKRTFVDHICFSPDGKLLAVGGYGGALVLFDAGSGKELDSFGKEFDLVGDADQGDSPMAFSPDGRTLAAIGGREALHFWDLATGQDRLATPEAHLSAVHALAFPADGKTLISGSNDRTVRIWDLATGRPTRMLAHDGRVWSLAVSADGSFLAAGVDYPRNVHLWNLKTGERLHSWPIEGIDSESVNLRAVTLGEDGSSVIVELANGALRCWDLSTGKERIIAQPNLPKPLDPAVAAKMLPVPHTARLAASSRDGRSKLIVRRIRGKEIKLASGEARQDYDSSGSMIVWLDTQTGRARREIEIPQSDVYQLALSPDQQTIAVGYVSTLYPPARRFIRIFRLRDKREIQTIESPCGINALAFTPDGKQIVAGLADTSIVIWDVRPAD
jgi:WD40 repeat protein